MYTMIPSNIAYFVFGFLSAILLVIISAVISYKKDMNKKEKMVTDFIEKLKDLENKDKDK